MPRNFRVAELLTPDELAALESFVREKNGTRTVDECFEWVLAKGYRIGRTAVWNWLDSFRLEEKTRRASEISGAYLKAAADTDPTAVASAALRKFQELILEYTMRADEADAGELMKLAIAMKTGVSTQQVITDLRTRFDEQAKKLIGKSERKISQADIEEVRKAVFG